MHYKINKEKKDQAKHRFVAGLLVAMLLVTLLVVSNPAQARSSVTDECEGRITESRHYVSDEEHKGSCEFSCDEGDYVAVEVINQGGRGRVTIVGECNGARGECINEVRACDETGGRFLADEAGTGECRFKVKHYWAVDKIFRCKSISPQGEYAPPPVYAMCVTHWLDEWILGGAIGGGLVEVCTYEGNSVCVDFVGTFWAPEPVPWVITCGTDLVYVIGDALCTLGYALGGETLCLEAL